MHHCIHTYYGLRCASTYHSTFKLHFRSIHYLSSALCPICLSPHRYPAASKSLLPHFPSPCTCTNTLPRFFFFSLFFPHLEGNKNIYTLPPVLTSYQRDIHTGTHPSYPLLPPSPLHLGRSAFGILFFFLQIIPKSSPTLLSLHWSQSPQYKALFDPGSVDQFRNQQSKNPFEDQGSFPVQQRTFGPSLEETRIRLQ